MFDQSKNLMIGLFVVAAISIIVFILLFIHPSVGDNSKILRVRFSNIDKVNTGTRVTFGGKPVGQVINIQEIIEEPNPRLPHDGHVYVYELTLAVDSSVDVYNSDDTSLRTSGLLGEKSVNIEPMSPKEGQVLKLMNNEIIYASESGGVEEAFKKIEDFTVNFEKTLDKVNDALDDLKKNELWVKIGGTFKNLDEITSSLNKPTEWSELLDNIHALSKNFVETWPKVESTITDLADASTNVKDISAKVRSGEGTVGKLVMTDDLYIRATSLMSKAETAMNDVNHYGLLFHLDKNWQRLRARRLNLMQKLCTPQQFRNYFNDEVDQIATSLSRVSMVLDKSGECPMGPNLVRNYEFTKVFAEFLRRVEAIEEELKLYNTQLNDYNVKQTELQECCH